MAVYTDSREDQELLRSIIANVKAGGNAAAPGASEYEGEGGTGSDIIKSMKAGAWDTAAIVPGLIAGGARAIGADTIANLAGEAYQGLHGLAEENRSEMSEEGKAANAKKFIEKGEDGKYHLGSAWGDWRSVANSVAESLPGMISSFGIGGAIAKSLIKRGLSEPIAWAIGSGVGEGSVAGAQNGLQVQDSIMSMPQDSLDESPEYKALLEQGYSKDEARRELASSAGLMTGAITSVTTGVLGAGPGYAFGRAVGRFGRKAAGKTAERGLVGTAGEQARNEAAEEFAQSAAEQYVQNVQQGRADIALDPMDDVWDAAVKGAFAGGVMGTGISPVAYYGRRARKEQQASEFSGGTADQEGMRPADLVPLSGALAPALGPRFGGNAISPDAVIDENGNVIILDANGNPVSVNGAYTQPAGQQRQSIESIPPPSPAMLANGGEAGALPLGSGAIPAGMEQTGASPIRLRGINGEVGQNIQPDGTEPIAEPTGRGPALPAGSGMASNNGWTGGSLNVPVLPLRNQQEQAQTPLEAGVMAMLGGGMVQPQDTIPAQAQSATGIPGTAASETITGDVPPVAADAPASLAVAENTAVQPPVPAGQEVPQLPAQFGGMPPGTGAGAAAQPDVPAALAAAPTEQEAKPDTPSDFFNRHIIIARPRPAYRAAEKTEPAPPAAVAPAEEAVPAASVSTDGGSPLPVRADAPDGTESQGRQEPANTAELNLSQNERGLWELTGNTFEHKEKIRRLGGRWNRDRQAWIFKPEQVEPVREAFADLLGEQQENNNSAIEPAGTQSGENQTTDARAKDAKTGIGKDLHEAMQLVENVLKDNNATAEEKAEAWWYRRQLRKASESYYGSTGEESNATASLSGIVEPLSVMSAMGADIANSKLYPKLEPFLGNIRNNLPSSAQAYGTSSYFTNSSMNTGSLGVPLSQGVPSEASRPSLNMVRRGGEDAISEPPADSASIAREGTPINNEKGRITGAGTMILGRGIQDAAHYEVRELSDVISSHDPENGFARRKDYPAEAQERPYHSDTGEQHKVRGNAQDYQPGYVLNTDVTAGNGPSIITNDGIVLGGNSRAMTLQLVYARHPDKAAAYRQELQRKADQFGIDPSAIAGMERPILVRVLEQPLTVEEMAVKSRQYNQTTTQKLQAKAEGVSRGRMISAEALTSLSEGMADFDTLAQFLDSPKSKGFVDLLRQNGVIEETELSSLMEKNGLLNDRGKKLVTDSLRGMVVPNYDILDAAPPSVLNKLDRAIPALVRLKARGGEWDLTKPLTAALRIVGKADAEGRKVESWLGQAELIATDPDKGRPNVQALALTLANATQKEVLARFETMAADSERQVKGRGMLIAKPENTPAKAFIRAFTRPLAFVDGKAIANFDPQHNATHAALQWAYDNGGNKHAVSAAQERLHKTLISKKATAEQKSEARDMMQILAGFSGTVNLYPPKLGQLFRMDEPGAKAGTKTGEPYVGAEQGSKSAPAAAEQGGKAEENAPSAAGPQEDSASTKEGTTKHGKSKPGQKIEDFGEKIGGARKDVWKETLEAAATATEHDLAYRPVSELFPAPNYQKMLDEGMNPRAVDFIHAARDWLTDIKRKSLYRVRGYMKDVQMVFGFMVDVAKNPAAISEFDLKLKELKGTKDALERKMDLYKAAGHGESLGKYNLWVNAYTYFRGQSLSKPTPIWTVESGDSTVVFGLSREEALEKFKQWAKEHLGEKGADEKKKKISSPRFAVTSSFADRDGNKRTYHLSVKARGRYIELAGPFDTNKEAISYYHEHKEDLLSRYERLKDIPKERRDSNVPRVGEDYRRGKDVTPEKFSGAFGFRGVEFGNWVEGSRRQHDLNEAYDALMDLAGVIGVSPKALSLNGELGLAFGARGRSASAAAHYEHARVVINLTKTKGAGALAHEWMHAIDNYFSRMAGDPKGYLSEAAAGRLPQKFRKENLRGEVFTAFENVSKAIKGSEMAKRSLSLDALRSSPYWAKEPEMAARAFEAYVIDKLKASGGTNDYLANVLRAEEWGERADRLHGYPYPTQDELPVLSKAFDTFFDVLEERKTDKGIALASLIDGRFLPPADGREGSRPKLSEVQAVADKIAGIAKNAAKTHVVQGFKDLPERIRGLYGSSQSRVEGMYDPRTDSVYLITDNLSSAERAAEVWAHEQIVHHGLRGLMPDGDYRRVLNRLFKDMGGMKNDTIRATAARYGLDPRDGMEPRMRVMEEVIAHLAEKKGPDLLSRAEKGLWQKIVDAVLRAWKNLVQAITGRPVAMQAQNIDNLLSMLGSYVIDGLGTRQAGGAAENTAEAKLARDVAKWEKTVDALTGKPSSHVLMLTQTPLIMHMLGADFKALYAAPHVFDGLFPGKATAGHHEHANITRDILKQIPQAITDPIAVFDSPQTGNTCYMLDVLDENGATVVAYVEFDAPKGHSSANIVRTVFAKEDGNTPRLDWFRKQYQQNLRYINTQKKRRWNATSGANSLWGKTSNASGNKVLTEADLVKAKEQAGGVMYQFAYHGSPFRFDEFTMEHIGEGEGVQAHGWGLYFAQDKNVSEGYREHLADSGELYKFDGRLWEKTNDGWYDVEQGWTLPYNDQLALIFDAISEYGTAQKAIEQTEKKIKEIEETLDEDEQASENNDWQQLKKTLDGLNEFGDSIEEANPGQLYKVDIPESDVLLDEDKTFSEQPEAVQNAVRKLLPKVSDTSSGKAIYAALKKKLGGPRKASLALNEQGVKGITYDGQQDGRCFVVFDDEAIQILDTYASLSSAGKQVAAEPVIQADGSDNPRGGRSTATDEAPYASIGDAADRILNWKTRETLDKTMADENIRMYFDNKDLSKMQRILMLPHWIAKKFPGFARVYERQIRRVDERSAEKKRSLEEIPSLFGDKANLDKDDMAQLRKVIFEYDGKDVKELEGADKYRAGERLANGRRLLETNEDYYKDYGKWLDGLNLRPKVREAMMEIRKSLDHDLLIAYNRLARMHEMDDGAIKRLRETIGHIQNYFPHHRYGKFYLQAVDPDTREVLYREHFDATLSAKNEAVRRRAGAIRANPELANARWSSGRNEKLPDEAFGRILDPEAMEQIIAAATDRIGDKKQAEKVRAALHEAVAETLKTSGWGSHAIGRKGVPGFESEDIVRVLYDYKSGLSGWLTKMEAARDFSDALGKINAKAHPQEWTYTSQYVRDVLRNLDSVDRFVGAVKSLSFAWYLGARLSTATLNLTQNIVIGIPRLQMDINGKPGQYLKAAYKQIVNQFAQRFGDNKAGLTAEEAQLIQELYGDNLITDAFMEEARGHLSGRGGAKLWNKFTKVMGYPMAVAERFNRGSIAIAAFNAARDGQLKDAAKKRYGITSKDGKATYEQAKAFAEEIVRDSHYVYGIGNMPEWLRGGVAGRMASGAYTFRSFTTNTLGAWHWALSTQGREGRKMVAKSLAATVALGGLTSFPFYATLMVLFQSLTGDDDDWTEQIRKGLPKNDLLRDVVCYGLPAMAGVNMGNSLKMETPVTDALQRASSPSEVFQKSLVDIFGIPFDLAQKPLKAVEAINAGNEWRAIEALMPSAVAASMRAYRLATEGQRTLRGKPINNPGQPGARKISAGEAVLASLGYGLTSSAKSYDAYQAGQHSAQVRSEKLNDIVVELLKAQKTKDAKQAARITAEAKREVAAWNKKMEREKKPHMTISTKDIVRRMKARQAENKPDKEKARRYAEVWGN